ncbi:DUF3343 domain-containing protein [Dehalobacterium formicoaceticum]|uniref:DUF3343 domain-containing protein n=1 Tax=Dehalobacterium formicoaceticum TaxID=51515 RepID=UPI003B84756A
MACGNTHVAMKVQKILNERGFNVFMMPTLRKIAAGCGLSIRFSSDELSNIQKSVYEMSIEPSLHQFYKVETNMGKYKVSQIG